MPRLLGKKVVINVDGLESKRAKWGRAARAYYRFAEFFSTVAANIIVSDAAAIKKNSGILQQYGLEPDGYFFIGSCLEERAY